jgi:hypothetical protein
MTIDSIEYLYTFRDASFPREGIRIMSAASRIHMLARPTSPPLQVSGASIAPGAELLLQGREDPSPGSGIRTGLVLMALLACMTIYTVSFYTPAAGGTLGTALSAAPLVILPTILLLLRSVKSI